MIPYILFFGSIVGVSAFNLENKKYINYFISILFIMFLGMRYDVGWDFPVYYELAYDDILLRPPGQYQRLEFLNKMIYKITWFLKTPQVVIFIYSFLLIFFIKKGLDSERKYSVYAWLTFISIPIFFFSFMSLMRQSVAVAIVFFSYKYIRKQNVLKFCTCIFLASLFHSTALFVLPIYFFNKIRLNSIWLFLVFITSFFSKDLLLLILETELFSKYSIYVTQAIGGGGGVIYYLIIFICLFIILISNKLKEINSENNFFINAILAGGYIYIALIDLGHLGPRMSMYFLIFILYLSEDVVEMFYPKYFFKAFFFLGCFLLMLMSLYVDYKNPYKSQFLPYKIFLDETANEFKQTKSLEN